MGFIKALLSKVTIAVAAGAATQAAQHAVHDAWTRRKQTKSEDQDAALAETQPTAEANPLKKVVGIYENWKARMTDRKDAAELMSKKGESEEDEVDEQN